MKLNLGNGHTWKRRLDDLRYAPTDAVRRARSARERGLAAWAGMRLGQRLSSLGLASAVVIAMVVIFTGGRENSLDLVVTNDGVTRADRAATSALAPRVVEPGTSAAVDETTAAAATAPDTAGSVPLDQSTFLPVPPARSETKVLSATTTPAKSKKVTANSSALAALFQAAVRGAKPASQTAGAAPAAAPSSPAASPTPTPTPNASPAPSGPSSPGTQAPGTTRPGATTPPTTRPPATTPPTTRPPTTVPPTTRPPTTVPPTTRPPTTLPPTTLPPTTAPPVTLPPTTAPPVTSPPTTEPEPDPPTTTDPPRPTPPVD